MFLLLALIILVLYNSHGSGIEHSGVPPLLFCQHSTEKQEKTGGMCFQLCFNPRESKSQEWALINTIPGAEICVHGAE